MKNLSTLLFFMVFSIIVGYTQGIPEKANAIVVTAADSNSINEKIKKVLADRDYTLSAGKTSTVIATMAKTLKNGTRVNYSFQIKGAEVILTEKLPVAGQPGTAIAYQGNKGTPMMNGWEEMDKIAKALGGKIKYESR